MMMALISKQFTNIELYLYQTEVSHKFVKCRTFRHLQPYKQVKQERIMIEPHNFQHSIAWVLARIPIGCFPIGFLQEILQKILLEILQKFLQDFLQDFLWDSKTACNTKSPSRIKSYMNPIGLPIGNTSYKNSYRNSC